MSELLNVSSNPHVRDKISTSRIMIDVLISLLPASAFGIYNFGIRAFVVILVTMVSCVLAEFLFNMVLKKDQTIYDCSALVTGLLLALNLPVSIPLWIAVIGSFFAIVVVKMVFGGLGQNFMNPALGARCFMLLSFTGQMTKFTLDGVTTATPLYMVKHGEKFSVMKMIIGTHAGTIGETSVIALLLGAIYLIIRRLIDVKIPLFYIGTFGVLTCIYAISHGNDMTFVLQELCGGGLLLGAFFMATDYVTSPITKNGRIVFGICLGLLTFAFRLLATENAAPEGVSYAIIISNLFVPIIERFTLPKGFGKEAKTR
ncbi:MAG: RnfABCDGE type electron transport complex subunit D [Lachnospiraceae bacterium]|nr:RnfABCDGE type electron transport complex subunit D [Lachnospiraceae bacterium]